jgi:malonate transporter MadM subunit
MLTSYWASEKLTCGRLHGSVIAMLIGLVCAACAGGKIGVADVPMLSGIGLMGGAMLRDLAIVATAFGVRTEEFTKGGLIGIVSLFAGLCMSFIVGGTEGLPLAIVMRSA